MDEDRIGLVLAKTTELRSKIINCINNTSSSSSSSSSTTTITITPESEEAESTHSSSSSQLLKNQQDEEEEENLVNIKDALESLESQLSSLQALQQQQWYEKEAALAEIQHSQKNLLKQLKEYKGKDFEVIHEAIDFASEKDDKNDLLLPPYPSRPSQSFPIARKLSQNGLNNKVASSFQNSESDQRESESCGPFKRLKMFLGAAAKMTVTVVGVIAILSLAGVEPRQRKRDNNNEFNRVELFQDDEKGISVVCPPGKVAVIEDGETRCVVKERVEIPFGSVVGTPDVSYGCG